jgi:hypothetical protein
MTDILHSTTRRAQISPRSMGLFGVARANTAVGGVPQLSYYYYYYY